MKLWIANRLDQEIEMTEDEVATAFLNSDWAESGMPLERALASWLAHPDGLNASWQGSEPFQAVADRVLELSN